MVAVATASYVYPSGFFDNLLRKYFVSLSLRAVASAGLMTRKIVPVWWAELGIIRIQADSDLTLRGGAMRLRYLQVCQLVPPSQLIHHQSPSEAQAGY
jgi:hypothetical protein